MKYLIIGFFIVSTAHAAVTDKQFSADAVITIPGEPQTVSKLYVGNNVVRTDINTQNGLIIDIVFPMEGKLIKLNPQFKQYINIPVRKQTNDSKLNANPCDRLQNASCALLGEELINGLKTKKWQVITLVNNKKVKTLHWIDKQRKLAVREIFNDGTTANMKLLKEEMINNRNVEKWVRTLHRVDGSIVSSYQWYDPQLKISIREELPGGYIRELKNIVLARQKSDLFKVPEGYSRVKPDQSHYKNKKMYP